MNSLIKPLGYKSYGSIPHLLGSRLGSGDHHIQEGQHIIATEKVRDKNDVVIVQEKLDGSNCAVAKIEGKIIALGRSGYLAETSNYEQHIIFSKWVKSEEKRFNSLLREGERVVGEWLIQACGTLYKLPHEPFVPFDLMIGKVRLHYLAFTTRVSEYNFITPKLIHIGQSISIENALTGINESGHGAQEDVEGLIYRVERNGIVDFLAKYVRHSKVDGKYFPENNNGQIKWNVDIESFNLDLPRRQIHKEIERQGGGSVVL